MAVRRVEGCSSILEALNHELFGEIVDLNRIPLPADTPIIDERFKDGKNK